ncbi:MAG: hypothetical protein ABIF11_06345 [Nitrospirota bacterium]
METNGICSICKAEVTQKGRSAHLKSCIKKHYSNEGGVNRYFLLSISGRYAPCYWLNIIFDQDWGLSVLDGFLRDVWVECCGHMSEFKIDGVSYSSYSDTESDDEDMDIEISRVVRVKDKFLYLYDFGSTTELVIKVIDSFQSNKQIKEPEIIARNNPPEIGCDECDAPATQICSNCQIWLCDKCSKRHRGGEDMMLPAVNSPRVGVCAYAG